MSDRRIGRAGWLALGLALFGSLVAIVNEVSGYRETGVVDWGHVAQIVGVPVFMFAIVSMLAIVSNRKSPPDA